jgi:hypothetical protein
VYELANLLNNYSTAVRRVDIKIYDLLSFDGQSAPASFLERRYILENMFENYPRMLVSVNMAKGSDFEGLVSRSGIRYGFEIVECDSSDKYLYTLRKIVPLQIHEKKIDSNNVQYYLHGFCGKEHLPVSATVSTDMNLNEGELVEVEVCSLYRESNAIKLINPKIVDVHNTYADNIDISYLLESKPQDPSSNACTIYERGKREIAIQLGDKNSDCFIIHNYSSDLINNRRRLLVESISKDDLKSLKIFGSGSVVERKVRGRATLFFLRGFFDGRFALKHVRLNGESRQIFYRLDDNKTTGGIDGA